MDGNFDSTYSEVTTSGDGVGSGLSFVAGKELTQSGNEYSAGPV